MDRVITVPNGITIGRGFIGFIGIFVAVQIHMAGGLFLYFVGGMVPDFWDGWYARKYNQQSRLGEILDPLIDKMLFYGAMVCIFCEFAWAPALVALFVCDVLSTCLHFAKSGGAVTSGKRKFVLQCAALGLFSVGIMINEIFVPFANIALIFATICAIKSLKERMYVFI